MRGILAPVFSFSCICLLFCFFSFSFPLQQPPRDSAAVEIKGRQEEEIPPLPGPAILGLSFWFDNITGEIEWEFKKGKGDR